MLALALSASEQPHSNSAASIMMVTKNFFMLYLFISFLYCNLLQFFDMIFYRRAQEQKKAEMEKVEKGLENPEDLPKIDEKNFRYPGPRPRTRESGILSLADIVESASRTIKKPTPAKIRALVEDLVEGRICDGQLDECPLTVRDLAKVKDSFCNTLRSMMHSRISYPKDDERTQGGGRKSDVERRLPPPGGESRPTPSKPILPNPQP